MEGSAENARGSAAVERDRIQTNFYRVAREPLGLYALMDYVNFKGEGVSRERALSWAGMGTAQVLERCQTTGLRFQPLSRRRIAC